MFTGVFAGITWALETVILGIALAMSPFVSGSEAIALAPFVSTFLHDGFSAVFMFVYNLVKGNLKELWRALKSKECKWLCLASAIGGPVGMTGYVLAVNYMGSSIGAVASAVYPAIGSFLAFVFLKEKVRWYQWIFLIFTLLGVYGISYSPDIDIKNFWLGILGALMCAFGWGTEGVILSKCLKNNVEPCCALQIRQAVSAIVYAIIILPALQGWNICVDLFEHQNIKTLMFIVLAAFCATVSYLFYYRAIAKIGVSKAMALNITYTAWAMVFSVVIIKNYNLLNPLTVICALTVVVCSLLSAMDFRTFFNKKI